MGFDDRPDVESSRHGGDDAFSGVFAMTALPDGDQSEDIAVSDFVGGEFNRLADEFLKCPDPDKLSSDLFAKLTSRVNRCRDLRALIEDRRVRLLEESRNCEIARREEAERQGESDGVMELIRKIEEDAARMENSIPMRKERVEELEREIEETKRLIALGAGWTEDQRGERAKLSDAIERARSEANERNANLADLRSRLGSMETEVEASIRRRDQSIESLECVNARMSEEQEKEQAVLLQCREMERSKSVLTEALRVAEIDLSETRAEVDVRTKNSDDCEREIEDLRKTRESYSGEFEELCKSEDEVSKELSMIISENGKIKAGNVIKRSQLDEISKEVQRYVNILHQETVGEPFFVGIVTPARITTVH
jgi:chromosome segregation ATPase